MTDPNSESQRHPAHGRERDRGLTAIAALKMLQGLTLVAMGFGTLQLINSDLRDQANAMFEAMGQSVDMVPILKVLRDIGALAPGSLRLVGFAMLGYAALFIIESIGLWRQRRWAEYLTVIATSSFIPFEIYEVVKSQTLPRIAALVVNVLVVAYLIYRIRNPTPWQVVDKQLKVGA